MKKLLTFLMASILAIGVGWAETVTLSNANIVAAGDAADGYKEWTNLKDGGGNEWKAFAIKNQHSNATSQYHFLQIKKYASKVAYYIQVPELGFKITGITMTVSSTNKPMDGGSNSATLFFSGSNSTSAAGAGVASGTGANSVTIDCSSLNLNTGYITASGAVRIWDVVVTYENTVPSVSAPVISGTTPFEGSTQVSISCGTTGASIYYTTDGNAPTTSSTPYSAPFTISETTTVKAIAALNGETSAVVEKTFTKIPTISSIAEFNALTEGDNFKYTGDNLVYIISNTDGTNHYVQDGEKGMLIYGTLGQTYTLGDAIPGGFTGTRSVYNGAPEMSNPAGFSASSQNVGLTPVELTPSQVNLANFGRYAIIKNVGFNTTDKIITAGDETIPYHTTFNDEIPTDGGVYDVIGVCGYYKPKNGDAYPQFLPISFEQVESDVNYYLVGSFNEWTVKDENYKFTLQAGGSYALTGKTFEADPVKFKVLKVEGETVTWLGGATDVAEPTSETTHDLTSTWHTNIQLVDGVNFKMEFGGKCDFSISAEEKITVTKEKNLFICGGLNDWGKTQMTKTETGWEYEGQIAANTEYKFRDEWAAWYGGGAEINETNLDTEVAVNDGNNFKIVNAGNYTITVNDAVTTMVVSLVKEPHNITIAEGIENGTVTIKDNKTTAKAGEVITIIATPANGYELGTVTVMAGETAVEVTEDYTFVMPDADVVVSATFVEKLEAMFNFDEDYAKLFPTLKGTSSNSSTDGDITEQLTATVDGVNLTVSPKTSGNNNNRIWITSPRLRVYSGTITVEAPEGCILTQTDFTNHSSNFNLTPNTGEISGSEGTRTWTGEASTVIFTIGGNTQIKTMNVSYAEIPADQVLAPIIEGVTPFFPTTQVTMTCETVGAEIHYTLDGSEPTAESTLYESPITLSAQATVKAIAVKDGNISTIASKEFVMMTNVATIAEYKELAAGTEFGFTGNVTVTYVNGRYLYVKDETGSALIYGDTGTEFEFTQGQVLAPNWTAKTKNYNGLLEAETPANLVATNETVEVVPAEMQLNAISTDNENEYIIVKNVTIGEPYNKNFTITDADENTITGRTNFTNVTHPTDFTVNYDITCVVAEFNGTVQLYPTDYKVHVDPVLLEGVVFAQGRNWATWYGDQNLALPEGVTAYIVTDISGENATVEALDYIPAETGVLLNCSVAKETVEAMPYEPDAPATITGNLLVGVARAQEVSNAYVLYNNEFVLIQDGTQVAAHRCYLQAGGNAAGAPRVLRIAAAGTVTGIDALVTDGNSGVKYYDLSGRYVGTSLNGKRGIFITSDGKKVVR